MGRLLLALTLTIGCGRSHEGSGVDAAASAPDLGRDFGPLPDYGPPPEPCPEPVTLTGVSGPGGPYPVDAHVTVHPVDFGGWGTGLAEVDLVFSVTGDPDSAFVRAHFVSSTEEPDTLLGEWADLATEERYEATIELHEPTLGTTLESMGMLRARVRVPDLEVDLAVSAPWCVLSVYI